MVKPHTKHRITKKENVMKCTKSGNKKDDQIWKGKCRICKAEFEAKRHELNVSTCPREHYEFALANCTECGAKSVMAVVLYPVR